MKHFLTKQKKILGITVSGAVLAGGLLAIAGASPALAATPTCDWVATYAGAWVPEYRASNTVNCNMVEGDVSAGVRQLQHDMNLCYGEHLTEDGSFGALTKAALERTQAKAGTTADGLYGPNTRHAMLHESVSGNPACIHVP